MFDSGNAVMSENRHSSALRKFPYTDQELTQYIIDGWIDRLFKLCEMDGKRINFSKQMKTFEKTP